MTSQTTGQTTTTYNYTVDNRLQHVEQDGTELGSYYYDPFGRRLWKEVDDIRTYFHYNDEGLVGEYAADGTEIKTYAYNPGSPWSTNPLFMKKDEQYYFYINDHLGTPQKIFAENGQTVWEARYTAFGMATVQREIIENNLRFPGQYYDAETGLHYNWHRFYDPETGRYISADPIGLAGGMNLYAYVGGQPGYIAPVDSRDACYEAHDRRICACPDYNCDPTTHFECVQKADHLLAQCLRLIRKNGLESWSFDTWIPKMVHSE
jgi:RHS repeat-associated protein